MSTCQRYRCRLCGVTLNAWLPVARCPDTARLLHHLGQRHPDQAATYLDRMDTQAGIETILLAEVYDAVDEPA